MALMQYGRCAFWCIAAVLALLATTAQAAESQARYDIGWDAPTHNCDNTAIPSTGPNSLEVFRIYYSKDTGRPNPAAQQCSSCQIHDYESTIQVSANARTLKVRAAPGTYRVTLTAVNQQGEESCYSQEIEKIAASETTEAPSFFEVSIR